MAVTPPVRNADAAAQMMGAWNPSASYTTGQPSAMSGGTSTLPGVADIRGTGDDGGLPIFKSRPPRYTNDSTGKRQYTGNRDLVGDASYVDVAPETLREITSTVNGELDKFWQMSPDEVEALQRREDPETLFDPDKLNGGHE